MSFRVFSWIVFPCNVTPLPPNSYSARNAGSNGDLRAAQVARSDAMRPDINTASNNKPSEIFGNLPPRSKNTGAMANNAQRVPVTNPEKSRKAFSEIIISMK